MIRELSESTGRYLGFEITGKVTLEQEEAWIRRFDSALDQHDKVSVIVVLGENARWGGDSGLEDLRWLLTHLSQFDKIAIVSESRVWKWLVAVDSVFAKWVGIREKHFDLTELDEAWRWLADEPST